MNELENQQKNMKDEWEVKENHIAWIITVVFHIFQYCFLIFYFVSSVP